MDNLHSLASEYSPDQPLYERRSSAKLYRPSSTQLPCKSTTSKFPSKTSKLTCTLRLLANIMELKDGSKYPNLAGMPDTAHARACTSMRHAHACARTPTYTNTLGRWYARELGADGCTGTGFSQAAPWSGL